MKIAWAPLRLPLRRRLQTFFMTMALCQVYIMFLMAPFLTFSILYHGNVVVRLVFLAYLTYAFIDQKWRHSVYDGLWLTFVRRNFMWKHFRDYFPVELVKTVDLTPDRNYLLASFPHGVITIASTCNLGNDIEKWLELFPKIRPRIATLDSHFWLPIHREFIRLLGVVSVSKESLLYYMSKSNDPNHPDNSDGYSSYAVGVAIGGAEEALDARPGRYVLTLKKRKGFVKVAIKTGAAIVPLFTFGEMDAYDQVDNPPESKLRNFQTAMKRITGVSPPLIIGRGFFQYTFGILPRRKRLVQVVGAPILVNKCDNPLPEYVNEVHNQFIAALNDLFEEHKGKYIDNSQDLHLIIN